MADALKEAFERMNTGKADGGAAANDDSSSGGAHEEPHTVIHTRHGKKHGVHRIGNDGKAESSMHDQGAQTDDCPLCGAK